MCSNLKCLVGLACESEAEALLAWSSLSGPARPAKPALPEKVPEGYVRVRAHVAVDHTGYVYVQNDEHWDYSYHASAKHVIVADIPLPRPAPEIVGVVEASNG